MMLLMMPAPPIAHFAVAAAERRVVARLRAARATAPERAIALDGLRRMESRRLAGLAGRGAVREVGTGRWYLDEPVFAEFVSFRRRLALMAVVAGALAALVVYYLSAI
jgi:hypothetical protein